MGRVDGGPINEGGKNCQPGHGQADEGNIQSDARAHWAPSFIKASRFAWSLASVQALLRVPFVPALGLFNRMRLRDLVVVFDQFGELLVVLVQDEHVLFAEVLDI